MMRNGRYLHVFAGMMDEEAFIITTYLPSPDKWETPRNVPPDFHGKAPFTVSVTDGHGGETVYNIKVSIGDTTKK